MLTVDGGTLDDVLSVPDALSRPRSDVHARVSLDEFYAASLRALTDRAEGAARAAEQAEGLRRTLDTLKR